MGYEKVVLFDGKDLSKWRKAHTESSPAEWIIGDDGAMTVNGGDIVSTETYRDAHIHVEFWLPYMPESHGQERANSGVYVASFTDSAEADEKIKEIKAGS